MLHLLVCLILPRMLVTVTCSGLSGYPLQNSSKECQCYLVSGSDPGYFQQYRFWDFRNIPPVDGEDCYIAPALTTTNETRRQKVATSSYLNSSCWKASWDIQNGPQNLNASVPTFNSAQNVYISRNASKNGTNSTFLTLRAHRLPSFMSIAEIQSSTKNILYSSIRARFRVIPNNLQNASTLYVGERRGLGGGNSSVSHSVDSGAVFGFFTYHSDLQESDVEILTRENASRIHYSTQPDYNFTTDRVVKGASADISLPNSTRYTDWLDHRMDWFPGASRWYVGNKLVRENTVNVPHKESMLILNLWGDGGNWSGNMSVGGQVTVGIEWIEMVYNVSDYVKDMKDTNKNQTRQCDVRCNVD